MLTDCKNSINLEQGPLITSSCTLGPAEQRNHGMHMTAFTYISENKIELTHNGEIIGIVDIKEAPQAFEPHVEWNDKATKRGIYNCYALVIDHLRQLKHVIIVTIQKYASFFDSLTRRGMLRKVGTYTGFDIEGAIEDLHLYQAEKTWLV